MEGQNGKLKNDFRDEVKKEGKSPVVREAERVGEEEMMRRDQYATMLQLRLQKEMQRLDAAYTQAAIERFADFLGELSELPLSDAREGISGVIEKQIEGLQNQLTKSVFGRPSEITLAVLEEKFATEEAVDDYGKETPFSGDDDTPEELKDEAPVPADPPRTGREGQEVA